MDAEIFAYETSADGVRILRCYSYDEQVEIPEYLHGIPVTELAPYVFSKHMDTEELYKKKRLGILQFASRDTMIGEQIKLPESGWPEAPELCGERLKKASIPKEVRSIGRYAFYNCSKMNHLSFYSHMKDLGAGVFTGCHHVTDLTVFITEGKPSCLKTILTEIAEELRVEYWDKGQYCRLIFPEYYEEGGEDTPAKNTKVIYHGSGLHFRNCFKDGIFQFAWYDERFFRAQSMERSELALELALDRLLYPVELKDVHRQNYEQFIKAHLVNAGEFLLKRDCLKQLMWLLEEPVFKEAVTAALLDQLTVHAGTWKKTEAVSFLMDLKHRKFRPRAKSFDL